MLIEFLTSKFFFLVTAPAAVALFVVAVVYANRSIGIDKFNAQVLQTILAHPQAAADYFKGRLIAISIIVGAAMLAGAIA